MTTVSPTLLLEHDPGEFSTEASMLRWLRQWPERFDCAIGNSQPFFLAEAQVSPEGDLQYIKYRQDLGSVIVTVFND
jgi:hypothetical protein